MGKRITRRRFFASAARTAAGVGVGLGALGGLGTGRAVRSAAVGPNEKIYMGLIGCGGRGRGDMHNHMRHPDVEFIALCDVDSQRLDAAGGDVLRKYGRAPKKFKDFRKMLEMEDLDAVIIATPDHWHSLIAIAAAEAGKDIYCEKPLSLTIAEGRAMVEAVRRYRRVFQTGSQQRSAANFRLACELVRNGRIGKLRRIRTCIGGTPRAAWEPNQPPPPHLDWNMWLGPAPYVPYTPKRCHYTFRWFWDYSGGKMTDWGAHHNDIAQWGNGTELSGPISVEGRGFSPADNFFETPTWFEVRYEYENGVELICQSEGRNGITFYGTDGRIFVCRGGVLECDPPEIKFEPLGPGDVHLYKSDDHVGNFLECVRTRKLPICDVEIGHRSCTVCHLGNIAIRLGRKLRWNPAAEHFVDDPEAERWIEKPMRAPWHL